MDENNFNNSGENQNHNVYGNGQQPNQQNDFGSQQPYQQSDFGSQQFSQPEPFAQAPSYTQPQYGYSMPSSEPEMSVKDWVITFLIMMVPCVNMVMPFIWAFSNTNKTRSNFFKAYLIMMVIMIVISVVASIAFGSIFAIMVDELRYMY